MKYEMMFVDEPWSLNYVVYPLLWGDGPIPSRYFNSYGQMVISRKYCIASFVDEEDARQYCELRNKNKEKHDDES